MKAYEVSLAHGGGRLAMAWHGSVTGQRDAIHLRYADTRGRPLGQPARLSDGRRHAYEPSLQMLHEDPVVAWYEKDDAGNLQAVVARFAADGTRRWRRELSPPGVQGRIPVVRAGADAIHVAWLQQGGDAREASLHHARLDADGNWLEAPRRIGAADADTWNLNAALDTQGRFHLVYDARWKRDSKELQLLTVTREGATHTLLSGDDGMDSSYPDLALQGDRVAITWFDARDGNEEIYLFAGRLADLDAPVDGRAIRVTQSPGASIGAYVAWNADRIGLAWCDDTNGRPRVYFRNFSPEGRPLDAARALTDGRREGWIPAIIAWHDGFAVGWNERRAAPASGEHATLSSFAALRLVTPREQR